MKTADDVRKYAAEQGVSEEEALKKGMEGQGRELVEHGARGLRQAFSLINFTL